MNRACQRSEAEVERLVSENRKLVWYVIRRTRLAGAEEEDAVSLGMEALLRAARGFDESRGIEFSTYAATCIQRSLWHLAQQQNTGNRRLRLVSFPDADGRPFTPACPEPACPPPDLDDLGALSAMLDALPPRERLVIESLYLEGKTLRQTGALVGVSKERVRQIKLLALARMRGMAESNLVS